MKGTVVSYVINRAWEVVLLEEGFCGLQQICNTGKCVDNSTWKKFTKKEKTPENRSFRVFYWYAERDSNPRPTDS